MARKRRNRGTQYLCIWLVALAAHCISCSSTARIKAAYKGELRPLIDSESRMVPSSDPVEMARSDVADGYLIVPVAGNRRYWDNEIVYGELLHRYGVDVDYVCGCTAPSALYGFLDSYRMVVEDAIQKKWNKPLSTLVAEILDSPEIKRGIAEQIKRNVDSRYYKNQQKKHQELESKREWRNNIRRLVDAGDILSVSVEARRSSTALAYCRELLKKAEQEVVVEFEMRIADIRRVKFVETSMQTCIQVINKQLAQAHASILPVEIGLPNNARERMTPISLDALDPRSAYEVIEEIARMARLEVKTVEGKLILSRKNSSENSRSIKKGGRP